MSFIIGPLWNCLEILWSQICSAFWREARKNVRVKHDFLLSREVQVLILEMTVINSQAKQPTNQPTEQPNKQPTN